MGDLAPALPGLAGVAPDQPVALAPAPGVQRVFRVPELQRIGLKFNIAATPESDVCFERRLTPLDSPRMLEAMQRQLPEARITILDHSKFNVPDGELEFPIAGLRQTPTGGFWSGSVRYAGGRRFAIWANVKVVVTAARVVAVENLKAGRAIDAAQLRVEMRDEFPSAASYAASIEELAGKVLRRPVNAGDRVSTQWAEAAKDVVRGETVIVKVLSGSAVLEFEGRAESSGSTGQNIVVQNPGSKKRFQARVEGKGRATVTASSQTQKGTT